MPRKPKPVLPVGKSYRDVRATVVEAIGSDALIVMQNYVENQKPSLWGAQKPRDFTARSVTIALFKDIENVGFKKMKNDFSSWYFGQDKSLCHNQKVIRELLAEWGQKQVKLGKKEDWLVARDNASLPALVSDAALWMDDCDFRLEGRRKVSKKDSSWSYKENTPAIR